MAVFNEPAKWKTSLVNNGDANVIPQSTPAGSGALSFDAGFPQITQVPLGAGGIAPDRKDFNAVMKLLGDAVFYMQNGGLWSYNPLFDYTVGRVVLYTDRNLYKCIQTNTSVAPKAPTNTAYWTKIALSSDISSFANTDLSNLSTAGQDILNRKASISLSNLNDTGNIITSRNAMPSLYYDDLTLGASGTSYTAPSNGYIYISKVATASNQYIYVSSDGRLSFQMASVAASQTIRFFLPIAKGAIFHITYSLAGTTEHFRFVYAIGSISEKVEKV